MNIFSNCDTKNRIVCSTLQLLTEFDFDKVTVLSVSKAAYVSRTSFYYYFEDVTHVLRYAESKIRHKICEEIEKADKANNNWCHELTTAFLTIIKDHNLFFEVVIRYAEGGLFNDFADFMKEACSDIIHYLCYKNTQSKKSFNNTHHYFSLYRKSGTTRLLIEWVENKCLESPAEIADVILYANSIS